MSLSFLPGAPRARALAEQAHARGKEVLLHLPLQAANDDAAPGPSEIHIDMSRERVGHTFDAALRAIPYVVGINGHRGSLLTRLIAHIVANPPASWFTLGKQRFRHESLLRFEEIRERDSLFFIDSYTHHHSVALQVAAENGVQALRRDVFLDPDPTPEAVAREFERLKSLARQRGRALAIGHPYPATLDLLERELPRLAEEGFELVSVSELFP